MGTFKNPDVWKKNLAYQIGDFVLYNGIVYMAIKPVPAGTEMSADYWTDFSGGGGGESTIDVLMWNINEDEYKDRLPTMVAYISGLEGAHTQLQFEPITTEVEGITVYGIKVKNCPVGASFDGLSFGFGNGAVFDGVSFGYSQSDFGLFTPSRIAACPMPIDGIYVVGNYAVSGLH